MIRTLRVQIDIPVEADGGLKLLALIQDQNEKRFPLIVTDADQSMTASPIAAPPRAAAPTEDWTRLIAPRLWLTRGPLTELLQLEPAGLESSFMTVARQVATERGWSLRADETDPPPPAISSVGEPAAAPPPPTKPSTEKLGPRPRGPNGGPPAENSIRGRFIFYLRDLRRESKPLPPNKVMAADMGVSPAQLGALLTTLQKQDVISYEWRNMPTNEDPTRQLRFVVRA